VRQKTKDPAAQPPYTAHPKLRELSRLEIAAVELGRQLAATWGRSIIQSQNTENNFTLPEGRGISLSRQAHTEGVSLGKVRLKKRRIRDQFKHHPGRRVEARPLFLNRVLSARRNTLSRRGPLSLPLLTVTARMISPSMLSESAAFKWNLMCTPADPLA